MKLKTVRSLLIIIIIFWMIIVFCFSAQKSEKSSRTSSGVINTIIETIPVTKKMETIDKITLAKNMVTPIRKLAHFSIYTVGGILIMSLFSTYRIETKKKITLTMLVGVTYACTDEFHQLFVQGRSAELRDVCIDGCGVLLGIMITLIIIKIYKIKGDKNGRFSEHNSTSL